MIEQGRSLFTSTWLLCNIPGGHNTTKGSKRRENIKSLKQLQKTRKRGKLSRLVKSTRGNPSERGSNFPTYGKFNTWEEKGTEGRNFPTLVSKVILFDRWMKTFVNKKNSASEFRGVKQKQTNKPDGRKYFKCYVITCLILSFSRSFPYRKYNFP